MNLVSAILLIYSVQTIAADKKIDVVDGTGQVIGHAQLKESIKGTKMTLVLSGVEPGIHAMHIHENGKCEGPKFTSAGGHFNPEQKKHGHDNPEGAHAGDLPNLDIPSNGKLKKEIMLMGLGFKEGVKHNLATATGTSLIIHAKADDGKTDPTGNAGDRLYCGVISEPK